MATWANTTSTARTQATTPGTTHPITKKTAPSTSNVQGVAIARTVAAVLGRSSGVGAGGAGTASGPNRTSEQPGFFSDAVLIGKTSR